VTDEDYIRKAVELAEGWEFDEDGSFGLVLTTNDGNKFRVFGTYHMDPLQAALDALAAQLVRQVDDLAEYDFTSYSEHCEVETDVTNEDGGRMWNTHTSTEGEDRTMNTIKAIVDSGVLGGQDE